ncbi:MAG: TIGR00645 family protein [Methylobacterium sp.]|nr:TIGR00645 family protein [Methylobacterium sp.]
MIERLLERFLFASRWLLAPFYVMLVAALGVLLLKAGQELVHFVGRGFTATESEVILGVLALVDLTLTGSLIVIVIFSGYENFVSRIDPGQTEDWPEWMGKIDFTGLKLKLLSSIVAISAIQVLKAFMNVKNTSDRDLTWLVAIHMVFVVSGLIMALTDRFSEASHGKKMSETKAGAERGQ